MGIVPGVETPGYSHEVPTGLAMDGPLPGVETPGYFREVPTGLAVVTRSLGDEDVQPGAVRAAAIDALDRLLEIRRLGRLNIQKSLRVSIGQREP